MFHQAPSLFIANYFTHLASVHKQLEQLLEQFELRFYQRNCSAPYELANGPAPHSPLLDPQISTQEWKTYLVLTEEAVSGKYTLHV